MTSRGALAALLAAAIAFALYFTTLLPGQDLGDTASFQATAGESTLTPRDGYPLYFAIGDAVLWATGAEPAHALNLASAIEAAAAVGLVTLVALTLCGSPLLALASGLLFAASYTFWSQAIIAEVYALHAVFVSLTLWLLLRWHDRPTTGRLAVFFGAYALGFGNHLSMILLAPAYTIFLLASAPRGWRSMFAPSIVALAVAIAAAGALQYLWNLQALRLGPHPPDSIVDALRAFWFDVTKTDWRESMILRVPESARTDRLAMYWFDVRQQFGWPAIVIAAGGAAALVRRSWRIGMMLVLAYAVNAAFAFTYNVGDTHVFYIPSHLIVALLASCGLAAIVPLLIRPLRGRLSPSSAVAIVGAAALIYVAARMTHDYPALDRSHDRRPSTVLASITAGLDDRHDILLTDLNWQLENGLTYFAKEDARETAATRMPAVVQYLPALVRDNRDIGRRVAATERARDEAARTYGPLVDIEPDPRVRYERLSDVVLRIPQGTRYVLTVLTPTRELALDREDLDRAVRYLTSGPPGRFATAPYAVIGGVAGGAPEIVRQAERPFRATARVAGTRVDVRMESWLAADTIRRMGFGQVVAARRHTLIVERGVSFVAFDEGGRPLRVAYAANIFAPQRRYLIRFPGIS